MEKLNNILPLTIKKLGLQKRFSTEAVMLHWREIVGDKIANHAWPVSVQRDLMFVAVNNSVWCHHLSMMKEEIIRKMNAFIGQKMIHDIRFQAGYFKNDQNQEDTTKTELTKIRLSEIPMDETELTMLENIVQHSSDEQFQQKIKKIVRNDFALKKIRRKHQWHKCAGCSALCPPGQKVCPICLIQEKQQAKDEISKTLLEAPWLKYRELKEYVPCRHIEYQEVKQNLITSVIADIAAGNDSRLKLFTLVMLTTGVKPDEINNDLVNKTLEKLRRKKYVFASRS